VRDETAGRETRTVGQAGDMCWIGDSATAGRLTQDVPLRGENRPTSFAFTYTFRSDDATVGNVTFKAVATPAGAGALRADNVAVALPTNVGR
jgi:hypothetical protein